MLSKHPWLADPCKGCPACQGEYWEASPNNREVMCDSTGKRHPWAWERCPNQCEETHAWFEANPAGCVNGCDGSGWVLVVTMEKVWLEFTKLEWTPGRFPKSAFIEALEKQADGRNWIYWWGHLTKDERLSAALDALLSSGA